MSNINQYATWELFLGEISRNISPSKEEIVESLSFLQERQLCSKERFDAIVAVRYMASYEQAINEYLHPPMDFKQANIKAELIHFGSVFEGLLEVLLVNLYKNRKITLDKYNAWFSSSTANELVIDGERLAKKSKQDRVLAMSFKAVIDSLKAWNKNENNEDSDMADQLRMIDMLRQERNSVHVNQMVETSIQHEEYRLVEVREKWLKFVSIVNKQI
ncbi:hypothetical protein EA848_17435 [Vibrio anguillarum]|uniref:hypothetical protein n=2 Tax=Vibrio anguillarum TaxID=55601 RepID=UPI00188C0B75|nr:hypothetical protein [Vibrio anguillarum]MBF4385389.1 hypothetical protein [Vibrio anguillarum]MBF4394996.1 hypothetical protein [Vibrio anguillarum]MBF4431360.1 hypothetical protein [Vibrio anguillarum]